MRIPVAVCILLCAASAVSYGTDWPQYRADASRSGYTAEDAEKADFVRQSAEVAPMTPAETRKYRLFVASLIIVWVAVLLFFSSFGIANDKSAKARKPAAAATVRHPLTSPSAQ